jgi:hypothetical protein
MPFACFRSNKGTPNRSEREKRVSFGPISWSKASCLAEGEAASAGMREEAAARIEASVVVKAGGGEREEVVV